MLQIVIQGRNEDVESWMNILVVVVLAVFWALGGILKAKRRTAQSGQKEQLPREPARRPPGSRLPEQLPIEPHRPGAREERRTYRPSVREARTKLAEWRAVARKFAAEAEQTLRAQMAEPSAEPPQTSPKPRTGLVAAYKSPQPVVESPAVPEDQPAPGPLETPPEDYLTELLSDYADADQLRRAILHYEILGRPLSVRDPDESAIGL